jgi:hypothetical protein
MRTSFLLVAIATLAASPALAQSMSVTRSGADGSTGGDNVNGVFAPPPATAPSTSQNAVDNGNPASDRSGAGGSTGADNVGANFASGTKSAPSSGHPVIYSVPYSNNHEGLGAGGSTTWRGPYQPR